MVHSCGAVRHESLDTCTAPRTLCWMLWRIFLTMRFYGCTTSQCWLAQMLSQVVPPCGSRAGQFDLFTTRVCARSSPQEDD